MTHPDIWISELTAKAGGAAAMTQACLVASGVLHGGGDRLAAAAAALQVLEVHIISEVALRGSQMYRLLSLPPCDFFRCLSSQRLC